MSVNSEEKVHPVKDVYLELGMLRSDVRNLIDDIKDIRKVQDRDIHELRVNQKQLLEFMYQLKGGRAWLMGMLAVSGAIGSGFAWVFGHLLGK